MIQVTFIAGSYQPNRCGVADYTAKLRQALSHYQVRSQVLTSITAAQTTADSTVLGAVHNWRLADLLPLVRTVRSTPTDILHIQHAAGSYGFQRPIFLLPLLLRLAGYNRPIITTAHEYGWWEWQPSGIPPQWLEWLKTWGQARGWWDREDGFLLTESKAILTTNANIATIIGDRLPHLRDRTFYVPIGANVEVFPIERAIARQQLRQQLGWAEDTQIITFFGFLHPVKGLETLLPAFQKVVSHIPQARLLLIGGVESLALPSADASRYWHQLHEQVAQLKLEQQVHFTGYVEAKTASHYLAGTDIGVLPFNHGITLKSGSLLTLFAHGLPVVATQKDQLDAELNNPELIHLIPPKDSEALAQALLKFLQNSDYRDRLSHNARPFAQQFDWTAIAQKHAELYNQVLT
jgi:polysaccharide biosynthesis protein PslF